jgi:hypothetical protein
VPLFVTARAYRDGTTHVVFEPLDFMARLAALVPQSLLGRRGKYLRLIK